MSLPAIRNRTVASVGSNPSIATTATNSSKGIRSIDTQGINSSSSSSISRRGRRGRSPGHRHILEIGSGIAAAVEEAQQRRMADAVAAAHYRGMAEVEATIPNHLAKLRRELEKERQPAIDAAVARVREKYIQQLQDAAASHEADCELAIRAERRKCEQERAVATAALERSWRERIRLEVLEARTDTWDKACVKERRAVADAVAEEAKKLHIAVAKALAAEKKASARAIAEAIKEERAEIVRMKAAVAEATTTAQEAEAAADVERTRATDADEKYQALLADYRRTLQVLPHYNPDANSWLL
eukprot:UC1_evm2s599